MKPNLTAFVVRNAREGSNEKPRWTECGAAWAHKSGNGFDLVLFDGLAVSGKVVLLARKERDNGWPESELGAAS
jgi:hypothetical protein